VSPEKGSLTQLLHRSREGDESALAQVVPLVYQELRRLAGGFLRRQPPGNSLQPTALVHEAYLRLVHQANPEWNDRGHFFHVAAMVMRQILVDHARAKVAGKRGGGQIKVEFRESLDYSDEKASEVVALDEALKELAKVDGRKAQAVELRYFGGLSVEEAAEALGVSVATVGREVRYAEAWLRRQMSTR